MTKKQEIYRKRLIKLCHTLKNNSEYFSDEDNRRDWLMQHFGCRSLTECTIDELEEFIEELKGGKAGNGITKKQIYAIKSMWEMYADNKDMNSLRRFINRTIGVYPFDLKHLTKDQGVKIITGLTKMFDLRG